MAEISRLPGPVADLWEWQFDGACRRADPDVFFHPEGERGPTRRRRCWRRHERRSGHGRCQGPRLR